MLLKLLFANFFVFASCSSEQPNIVFILADDLGNFFEMSSSPVANLINNLRS